jgi:hypothetical protein
MAASDPLCLNQQIPNKKIKNDSRYQEEIEFSSNWSRFIVLKSNEGCSWFPNEKNVRNINYSIDPLATAFFNDPFS